MRNSLLAFGSFSDDAEGCLAGILAASVRLEVGPYFALHFLASSVPVEKNPSALIAFVASRRCAYIVERNQLPLLFRHAQVSHRANAKFQPCENQTAPVPRIERDRSYSVKTTDCTPEISKRFRQRIFLQAIRSSLRSM
jgi:hypothetical protein